MERKPRPCGEHSIWADFPGGGPCERCGWYEIQIANYRLETLIDGREPRPQLRVIKGGKAC